MSRAAVTGIGVVAPGAIGIEAFRGLLASGRSAIEVVDRFDVGGLRGRHAALVRGFNARDFIAPMKMRRMNALSRLGVAAAKMAFDDAPPVDPATTGVVIGTAFGPVQTSVDYMREYVEKGASLAPPQLFAESVANAPGSHIAIEWGLRGFNVTVTQRESSALSAAMYGASQVVKGTVTAAVIGGVEEVNEMIFSVLDRLGALGNESRPFDRRRDGLVPGEGSAVLVVEEAKAAEAKEAYGHLAGFGMARDTTATISDWGEDHHSVVAAMRAAIDDAELTMHDIDAIYASANSTLRLDRIEYCAVEELFGEAAPPVVATKGYFGEYAAGGALQLVAALLAIDEQMLHASCGFEEGDAEMRIDVVRERRPAALRNVLVNSISAGGGIVSAVISREAA
jgi:3-oxoacyl-[acyl-carrier-protein] synthase II